MADIAILTAICATAMLFLGCFFVALCKNTCNRYLVHLLRFENTGDWELENTNEPDHSPIGQFEVMCSYRVHYAFKSTKGSSTN
jgi:hypothetical protein